MTWAIVGVIPELGRWSPSTLRFCHAVMLCLARSDACPPGDIFSATQNLSKVLTETKAQGPYLGRTEFFQDKNCELPRQVLFFFFLKKQTP
jgi:hypothetical protein